jgi:hypothetical protein
LAQPFNDGTLVSSTNVITQRTPSGRARSAIWAIALAMIPCPR